MERESLRASGVARAQPMPGDSMGTLCLRVARTQVPPSFSACSMEMQKQLAGSGGIFPRKFWNFLSFLGRFCGYFRPYRRLELKHFVCYEPTCVQRKVTVVLTANTYTSKSGEHTDLVIVKIQIAKLRNSISTPLRTFSAQFAIDNSTFGTNNFQECLHWWGTTSSC